MKTFTSDDYLAPIREVAAEEALKRIETEAAAELERLRVASAEEVENARAAVQSALEKAESARVELARVRQSKVLTEQCIQAWQR